MQWSDSLFQEGNPYGSQLPGSRRGSSTIRPPATGAWLEGDNPGSRKFLNAGDFEFEYGSSVPLRIAYETWGELNADRSNAILLLHALTGDSHAEGPSGPAHPTSGWWPGIVGPGLALDTTKYFVIAPNMLGGCQGTTGPAAIGPEGREYGARFPRTTIRDQVRAQAALIDGLGISTLAAVVGGSVGGMQALEWGVMFGDRVDRLIVLSAPPVIDAMTIAQNTLQADAIRLDPLWARGDYYDAPAGEGPNRGLALARRLAMLQYRSDFELDNRFGRSWQSALAPEDGHGRYAVESYLDFHGNRFTRRFDANSYITLTTAMNTHDVGRDRGGVEAALSRVSPPTLVIGIDSDTLFRVDTQHRIAAGLPHSLSGDKAHVIESPFGHDGFLLEIPEVSAAINRALEEH